MKGFLATVIVEDNLFIIEFFKLFRIGLHWNDEMLGNASVLILGIHKIELNIALVYRRKLEWHDFGKETGQS